MSMYYILIYYKIAITKLPVSLFISLAILDVADSKPLNNRLLRGRAISFTHHVTYWCFHDYETIAWISKLQNWFYQCQLQPHGL